MDPVSAPFGYVSSPLAATAYVLANPIAAGLVRRGAEWPGLWTAPEQLGVATLTARRPKVFFDPKSYLPEASELELTTPPAFASGVEFRALVSDALRALEEEHQREIASQGRRFLGAARVLAQSVFARPPAGEPRFELKPRIAARDKWRRVEGLLRLRSFLREYRQSWLDRRAGMPDVQFPAGTYLLRIMHGVQCAGAA